MIIGHVLTGRVKHSEKPTENDSKETRQRFPRESMKTNELNGTLYGRLPMVVANGSLEYESSAVSTVLAHHLVHPEAEGNNGYLAFQELKTKHMEQAPTSSLTI